MTLLNKIMLLGAVLFSLGAAAQESYETFDFNNIYRGERVNVNCNSGSYRYNTCYVGPGIVDAYLARQISRTQCVEGQNWGYTYDSIWVDKGCRADFTVILRGGGHGGGGHGGGGHGGGGHGGGGHGGGYVETLSCASGGYAYNTCYPQNRGAISYVQLSAQHSRTACVEGDTWGWDYDRVWVDKGCRGEFRVYFR